MFLTTNEKIKRLEIAGDLLEYAMMMEDMVKTPPKMIKNIFREREKQYPKSLYSEEKFRQIKKHHYFAAVTAAFSFVKDEYFEKLNLKNSDIDISEDTIERLFVNPSDVDLYRNPMDGNKIKTIEILKHIRDALNHHENGILYKYIEDEDAIEIDLKNLGITHNGKKKTLHVKVPVKLLMSFVHTINSNKTKSTRLIYMIDDIDYNAPDPKEKFKHDIKVFRIIPIKGQFDISLYEQLYSMKHNEIEDTIKKWQQEGKIKVIEYTYDNGAITDLQIDSIYEQMNSAPDYDGRTNMMYDYLYFVNEPEMTTDKQISAKAIITKYLCMKDILPFSIVSFDRFDASAIFNNLYLKNWNCSYSRIFKNNLGEVRNLYEMTNLEWFLLDPLERIYTEYENFIRYAIVNFAPIGKNNKPKFIIHNGKKYNSTFLRNAFTHGRVGIVKRGGQYLFALYDTPAGLGNEVKYCSDEDFKPKMYTPIELIELAQQLCISEEKKIAEETPKAIQELGKLKTELLSNTNTSNVIANKKKL